MEEDDIVMMVGSSLGGKGCKPEELIRRCQA
jgi:hypothetical protein